MSAIGQIVAGMAGAVLILLTVALFGPDSQKKIAAIQ